MKERFKKMIQNNRWIKWIPNFLTICNSLCGFVAILVTLQSYKILANPLTPSANATEQAKIFAISACMILFAMVFDACDGFAARILNAASMHGIQMDSLSDMVTFGVAPATLVAVMAHNMRDLHMQQFIIVWIFCAIYLGCAALRLATYNVHAILEKKSSEKFSGLPSPGAAAAICSLVILFFQRHGELRYIIAFLPVYAAILGLLMVSNVPYMHFGKWVVSTRRNKKRMLVLILIILSLLIFKAWAAAILINAYVVWGPLVYCASKLGFIKPPADDQDHREVNPELSGKADS